MLSKSREKKSFSTCLWISILKIKVLWFDLLVYESLRYMVKIRCDVDTALILYSR